MILGLLSCFYPLFSSGIVSLLGAVQSTTKSTRTWDLKAFLLLNSILYPDNSEDYLMILLDASLLVSRSISVLSLTTVILCASK